MEFLIFLGNWLAGNILNYGFSALGSKLDEQIASLQRDPAAHGWDAELSPEERRLMEALRKTKPRTWSRWVSKARKKTARPIAVIGPSGSGKTCVAFHLAGIKPKRPFQMSDKTETKRQIAEVRATKILVAPGSYLHGEGPAKVFAAIKSRKPPKVVCNVVAGGFNATARRDYFYNFTRPQYGSDPVASSLDGFVKFCRTQEEIKYIEDLSEVTHNEMQVRIPWFITVVNKRDLWQARDDANEILNSYSSSRTKYGQVLKGILKEWGVGDVPTSHDVFPAFLDDNGFSPDPTTTSLALTRAEIQADAMILRALVFHRYTEGSVTHVD